MCLQSVPPRRLFNIPVRDKVRGLSIISSLTEELLRTIDNFDINIEKLFYWSVNLPSNYPVAQRSRPDFFQSLIKNYQDSGAVLSAIDFNAAGTSLDWTYEAGFFKLILEPDGSVKSVCENKTNTRKALPIIIQQAVVSTFTIENNEFRDQALAMLCV